MLAPSRYAVTVPSAPGGHAPPEVLVVHVTVEAGPHGEPVYADVSGRYRFTITGQTARLLPGPVETRSCHRCLHALPLP
jgi:hypothetical protein